jgi:hypothetical protein
MDTDYSGGGQSRGDEVGSRQGSSYAGRGPKGYRRQDERITEDVNERLTQDSYINAEDIEVNVSNGEVTLEGTVESRRIKRMAEDLVEQISGVNNVINHLRVQSGQKTSELFGSSSESGSQDMSSNRKTDSSKTNDSSKTDSSRSTTKTGSM